MSEKEDGLHSIIEYNTALFDPAFIKQLFINLDVLLNAIASDPKQHVLIPGLDE